MWEPAASAGGLKELCLTGQLLIEHWQKDPNESSFGSIKWTRTKRSWVISISTIILSKAEEVFQACMKSVVYICLGNTHLAIWMDELTSHDTPFSHLILSGKIFSPENYFSL